MIRLLFDSDTPQALDPRHGMGATYADIVQLSLIAKFQQAGSRLLIIDRGLGDPHGLATIIDVERGARKPGDIPAWHAEQAARGLTGLTVYCNRSNLAAVDAAVNELHLYRWIATLDGTLVIPGFPALTGPAAVQFGGAKALGLHADVSLVYEPGWHPLPISGTLGQQMQHIRQLAETAANAATHVHDDLAQIVTAAQ